MMPPAVSRARAGPPRRLRPHERQRSTRAWTARLSPTSSVALPPWPQVLKPLFPAAQRSWSAHEMVISKATEALLQCKNIGDRSSRHVVNERSLDLGTMNMPQDKKPTRPSDRPQFNSDAEIYGMLVDLRPAWPLFSRLKQILVARETKHREAGQGRQGSYPAYRTQ